MEVELNRNCICVWKGRSWNLCGGRGWLGVQRLWAEKDKGDANMIQGHVKGKCVCVGGCACVCMCVCASWRERDKDYKYKERISGEKKGGRRTSLVVQWLRIHLPMQVTQVWSLVWEDPTCHRATKPVHHNYWALCTQSLCSAAREATTIRSLHTATRE